MCGIAGIFSNDRPGQGDIQRMTESLAHRGPDAFGYFHHEYVALGHRRLSILDLDARSNQPFHSRDKRYVLIFNGEIYNFRQLADALLQRGIKLNTTSDTEVLIEAFALWGVDVVHKLNGMFAFAIYDTQQNTLFLCRDRLGKKPLFYYHDSNWFIFGSEIKSLLKHPVVSANVKINKSSLYTFLHLGYIPHPATVYQGIHKFPAGCSGVVQEDLKLKITPYWNVKDYIRPADDVTVTVENAKHELKNLLTEAVASRLISDVPLGTFLSGGTDSSIITALASKQVSGKLKTFSIGFQESKFNETEYARSVAKVLGTEHHEYILSEREAVNILETYLSHFDEPFADTSAIPTMLVSRLARKEVTVALTGDGGDELFLGYGSYDWAERMNSGLVKSIGPLIASGLNLVGSNRLRRAAHLFERVEPARLRSHIFSQEQYFFSDQDIRELITDPHGYTPFEYDDLPVKGLKAAEQQALFDLQYYLTDDLLVKVDRASMFHALECRCPLLDRQVVEYTLQLPFAFKQKGDIKKWILKELLSEYLPSSLVHRPKWGFSIPLGQWLKNELRFMIDQYLSRESVQKLGLFNYDRVNSLVKSFLHGRDYLYNRVWVLIVIHKWVSENG
ncbi:MAG TPA: asparagine synthase (glutamine-hydrolyzing) [Ohtaekwangia sp.]